MVEQGGNLTIGVYRYLELNLHDQNQSAISNQIVVGRHSARERKLAVGVEGRCSASYEMILLACRLVRALDALPIGV